MKLFITEEILKKGQSRNGGWNMAQLRLFGIDTLYHGWRKDLLGKETDDESVSEFIRLKDAHLKGGKGNGEEESLIVFFYDEQANDFESKTFKNSHEVDQFCNSTVDETMKSVFVVSGEIVAKYYPRYSKRKGNMINKTNE